MIAFCQWQVGRTAQPRLLGCADSYLASTSYSLDYDAETDWKRLHDRALAACRTALGEEAFATAWRPRR